MYIQPKSLLSRLLEFAWTILWISLLLRLAVYLLADAWIWIVVIVTVAIVIRIAFWWRRLHRELW